MKQYLRETIVNSYNTKDFAIIMQGMLRAMINNVVVETRMGERQGKKYPALIKINGSLYYLCDLNTNASNTMHIRLENLFLLTPNLDNFAGYYLAYQDYAINITVEKAHELLDQLNQQRFNRLLQDMEIGLINQIKYPFYMWDSMPDSKIPEQRLFSASLESAENPDTRFLFEQRQIVAAYLMIRKVVYVHEYDIDDDRMPSFISLTPSKQYPDRNTPLNVWELFRNYPFRGNTGREVTYPVITAEDENGNIYHFSGHEFVRSDSYFKKIQEYDLK